MSDGLHVVCPHCNGVNRVPEAKLGDGAQCGRCKKPLFIAQPLELTSSNFSTHVGRSDLPVLIDFWAPWCGPCKMMAPVFTQAAGELEPRYRVGKVNTEAEQGLAAQFNIRSIPTLALFKQGKEVARLAGAMDLKNLLTWVRQQG
ncbi:MAG: thioredoxin TrxC [Gammaproteobacteria bacterium]|nr:thioredoxin TrxC [Gammaproteobacteria bacterium]